VFCVCCVWFGVWVLGFRVRVRVVCVSVFGVLSACGGGMCGACVLVLRCLLCACGECWVCVEMFGLLSAGCVYLCMCVYTHMVVLGRVCVRARMHVHAHMHACINLLFCLHILFFFAFVRFLH
jgi:hypothetical protein